MKREVKILEYQDDFSDNDNWKPSQYSGEIAERLMYRHQKEKAEGWKSNIRYRWRVKSGKREGSR